MALGKYTRIDGQNSSCYCMTISIVVFVSTFFIGAWMSMSSSIGPLGVGMTLQQFMVGMPKTANLNNADLHEKALKMNGSRITVQDDSNLNNMQENENVIPNEPQSSEVSENRESELIDGKLAENVSIAPIVAEKSVLWNEEENKGLQERNGGSPDVVDTRNQEEPTEKYVDSTVKTHEDDNETKQVGETKTKVEEDGGKLEVHTEKYVDSTVQTHDGDNETKQVGEIETKVEENGGNPEKLEVPTEKYVDSSVQTHDGDNETKQVGKTETKVEENGGNPEKLEVPTEKYVDSSLQTHHDGDNETKQVGQTETRVEENGGNPEKIPLAWMNAKKIQDKKVNQTEKPSQKQHKSDVLSGVVSNDGNEMSNQTSSQGTPWPTQAAEPDKEKALEGGPSSLDKSNYSWKVCNTTAGPDYIPCLDNIQAIKKLQTTSHYEHRERHCPDEAPICLVPLPKGYKTAIKWPKSRDMIWFSNVPHTMLAEYKGGQNWVKVYDRYLTFPGGGTQFKYGALHYIDYLEQSVPDIAWGRQSRVVLDVGCGVASFGGYLFERDVLTMSLAPKDEHEAQVQFALERGIPAISAVMGTKRLPFPSMVFDVIHCARCRVPWHVEGGKLLLELNRLLRPGGYFVWSATPVYRKDSANAAIWKDMSELTQSMCWDLVKVERDTVNRKAAAVYRKPVTNNCYEGRQSNDPPLCEETDDSSSAWYTLLQSCIHKVPTNTSERGSQWPAQWPSRLDKAPYWLKGDDASWDISNDYSRWKHVVTDTYLNGSGIDWSSVRNVMDMRASYGGFAAALKDLKLWVMNVVPVNSSDTLPIIYERGLFGIYHDWCESFSTYPRSYDLLHANHLFSDLQKRCTLIAVMTEVDRILRPGGWLIIRDDTKIVSEVESIASSLHWKIKFKHSKDNKQVFCVEKTMWRPSEVETISSAIG